MSTKVFLEDPSVLGGCVYYAQNREDLILQSFFPDTEKGFYVDVGAFDPDYDSVTKLFYKRGWHGINIEPQPEKCKLFQAKRKRDINLNVGIAIKESKLTLRAYRSGGLATFSETVKHDYELAPDADTEAYTEIVVPVWPLRKVLTGQKVTHIDFMKVDVEGFEYEVLASNDWKRFRPEVICIEANHIEKDWRPLLKSASYEFVFDDGLNYYYTDKHTNRKAKFNFIKDVVNDRGGGLRADHFERMFKLYEYATQKAHHVEELLAEREQVEQELHAAQGKIMEQTIELNSVKATAKRLTTLLRRNVKGK